ncbi:MAG: hypothetical protein R3337_00285 [Gammaproteobacteria bacterium]|nr:hypothetical protein [Gammaproteobacteria bacterium]
MILVFAIPFVVGLILGVWWLLWELYTYAVVGIFNGPALSYWQFVACWVLLCAAAGLFRSRGGS